MDETITAEEKLKQLNEERKALKEQVKSERDQRLEEAAHMREERENKIEKIQLKLQKILNVIYAYNKLGKVAKDQYDILGLISKEINSEDNKDAS